MYKPPRIGLYLLMIDLFIEINQEFVEVSSRNLSPEVLSHRFQYAVEHSYYGVFI